MSAWGKKPPAPSATGSDTVSPALSDAAIVAQSPVGAVGGPASHTSWITGSTIRITTLSGEVSGWVVVFNRQQLLLMMMMTMMMN